MMSVDGSQHVWQCSTALASVATKSGFSLCERTAQLHENSLSLYFELAIHMLPSSKTRDVGY